MAEYTDDSQQNTRRVPGVIESTVYKLTILTKGTEVGLMDNDVPFRTLP